jgi:ELWxxDGT repeat protein
MGGTLYFSANDGKDGRELWKSDGTAAGTVMVKDIKSGGKGSYPGGMTNVNGMLLFSADGGQGLELWKSDGTAAGTVLVKDINPGSGSSNPGHLINANGTLFFWANDGTHGIEPWKSDGTTAGTVLVKDINPGSASSYPVYSRFSQGISGGHLFFTADDGVHGTELWDPPVGPATATVVVPTSEGMSRAGGSLRLSAWPHQVEAGAGIPSAAGAPLNRPLPDGTPLLAEHLTSSVPARAGEARSTDIFDQALAVAASRPKKTRFGWALDRLGGPDLLEDFAASGPPG